MTAVRRDDGALARRLARETGALLCRLREMPDRPSDLRAAGDAAAQAYMAAGLTSERPHDAVLSEEAADDPARLEARRVWVIDPLDGTREFSEGRADWAVHIALWEEGRLTAGAVALPALDVTIATDSPPVVPDRRSGPRRVAVSRSRPDPAVLDTIARISADAVPMGSAGYKTAAVLRGEVDAYLHAGGQYEWDSAAPVAVATAAGLHASRLDGSPLTYNLPDPYLPDLLVCRREFVDELLEAVAPIGVRS